MVRLLRLEALLFSLLVVLRTIHGHGRLVEPPSRSSMWRFGLSPLINYDDNQLFCGGVQVQYEQNGGKCGVCGDPWNGPRDNEPGGKYYTGTVVRNYKPGQSIPVKVELTASHKGYFEYRLCVNDEPNKKITHDCLDKNVLEEDGTGRTQHPITTTGYSTQNIQYNVLLPKNVRCNHCVLQWKYNAGNSWGTDPVTGVGCIGCGNQEQFYGCADISIGGTNVSDDSYKRTDDLDMIVVSRIGDENALSTTSRLWASYWILVFALAFSSVWSVL